MPSSDRPTYVATPKYVKEIVIRRAAHHCEACGKYNEDLEVHHIIPRCILELLSPAKQNDPAILAALCPGNSGCHEKYDMINKEQIRLFKSVNKGTKEPADQITIDDILNGGL